MRHANTIATVLAAGSLVVALGSGCNAVFGLDDVDFGSGGATAASTSSTGDGSTSEVSSSGSGGEGGGSGGSPPDLCEETSLIVAGDMEGGAEGFWDEDNTTITAEVAEGDLALRIAVVPDVYASATYDFDGSDLCAAGCIRTSFSILTPTALSFGLGMQDDQAPFGLSLIDTRLLAADPSFQSIETEPCRIPPEFTGPERVSFVFDDGGDFYLDDVVMVVDDCPPEADMCGTFGAR